MEDSRLGWQGKRASRLLGKCYIIPNRISKMKRSLLNIAAIMIGGVSFYKKVLDG